MRLIAQGYTNRQISEELSLCVRTVEFYRTSLMQKLVLCSRAILARIRSGSPSVIPDPNLADVQVDLLDVMGELNIGPTCVILR